MLLNGGVKSTGADPDEEDALNPRQDEVDRFNSSIHIESGKRVFSYFWKVLYKLRMIFGTLSNLNGTALQDSILNKGKSFKIKSQL